MKPRFTSCLFALLGILASLGGRASVSEAAPATSMKAGLAKIVITPDAPVWMAGYASRTKPSQGKIQDLCAKALAIEGPRGQRAVIVTTDLLGLPGALTAEIGEHAAKSYGLRRGQILFNSSHTHTGPVLAGSLAGAYNLDAAQTARVKEYTYELKEKLIQLIGLALKDLAPASFEIGRGTAPFAMNRRESRNGNIVIGVNPNGVADRDVPVLRVATPAGALRGILFGYACHNTTLTGEFYQLSGDYAGFAQEVLERAHPGALALFVMGCGADINPHPRSSLELAEQHGGELAQAVESVLGAPMRPVRGEVQSVIGGVGIPFGPLPTREEFQGRLKDSNIFKRMHAERMLARMDRDGALKPEYPYTVQLLRIGDLTIVALAGEVVTDYGLRLKRELGGELWVAGYSNDLCSYIPSARMFKEGGYEVVDSQIYYDQPAPYDPAIEERIIGKVHELARSLKPAPRRSEGPTRGRGETAMQTTRLAAPLAEPLAEKRFQVAAESEGLLDLTAAAPGTSWLEAGREAAAVTVFLDGKAHQDVLLFNGARVFTYNLLLGRLSPGEHSVRVEWNRKQSAAGASTVEIRDLRISTVDRSQPAFLALAHAPLLFARPNTIGKFSDVPLTMYYETERVGDRTRLRYSVIFSNEDGGTQTAALMARWGRTTDIEWVIETELDARGAVVSSIYQGVSHETKAFRGKREADHPLMITASDNNNFADNRESEMRFALRPIPFDLSRHSREEVMDQAPWIYRIMAEEMIREGKITPEGSLGREIVDLRRYLYIDAASEQRAGTGISFAVKLKGNPHWFTSDLGIPYNKIDRSGYFQTTIQLPQAVPLARIERLVVRCDLLATPRSKEDQSRAAASSCDVQAVNKAFLLDDHYQPKPPLQLHLAPTRLKPGEMLEIELPRAAR